MLQIVDTHQHFLPEVYVQSVGTDVLARAMPGGRAPTWSAPAAVDMMDRNGIATGVISISAGPVLRDAADLLRRCNDTAAELGVRYPGRFGSFASLPLPDVDATLAEIAYAGDQLNAAGYVVFTHYDGDYLGSPRFRPVLAELNSRRAVVFVHPIDPPTPAMGLPSSIIEFPFETTRAATSLILSGALREFPDIRFVLSHAGGTLPFLASRLIGGITMNPDFLARVGDPVAAIRSFWFDVALSASESQIAALRVIAAPDRILFGTDFPMAPGPMIEAAVATVRDLFGPDASEDVFRNNADKLLLRP